MILNKRTRKRTPSHRGRMTTSKQEADQKMKKMPALMTHANRKTMKTPPALFKSPSPPSIVLGILVVVACMRLSTLFPPWINLNFLFTLPLCHNREVMRALTHFFINCSVILYLSLYSSVTHPHTQTIGGEKICGLILTVVHHMDPVLEVSTQQQQQIA